MQISEAESVVMDVLWRRHPLGAEDVVLALADRQDWQEPTIKTLLNRLLNKGAISAAKDGRRYLYSPLLRREDWARARLVRHAGKTVRFALGGFSLGLTIDSEGLAAQADAAVVPDVTLTVAPEKLPLPRLGADRETPDFAEATHISGDAALAQVVADLSKQLR